MKRIEDNVTTKYLCPFENLQAFLSFLKLFCATRTLSSVIISVYLDYTALLVRLDLATNDITYSMSIPQL